MMKKITLILCSFLSIGYLFGEDEQRPFLDSFIRYYDITTSGRYTHEYHPFLFGKSSYSLDELEDHLTDNGLAIKGRLVIAGYEEQAVPSYYTNYKVCTGARINDEVRVKDASGWTTQLHNKFGLMTGYLFRDIPKMNAYLADHGAQGLCEHINLDLMPIYDDGSWIFQRHAFGRMLPVMQREQNKINLVVAQKNQKQLFKELVDFWKKLYELELQFGNRKVVGTQDVLFSIAHGQHLYRSNVPLFKYYVGPDITYPIKVTTLQKESATYHAQTFVKSFVKKLKPVEDKATVYIFCSFVDGVGKSTLLGNIQNYKKHGDDLLNYDPVDNSSSQLAQLYKYDDKVFIADLPAQMSHFTYKPDGMVYFDPLAAGMTEESFGGLKQFVLDNKDEFVEDYEGLLEKVRLDVMLKGWFDESFNDPKRAGRAFIKNLLLLKRDDKNLWIPFVYQGKHYLFHKYVPQNIRVLVRLEIADSIGLKNYEPEQMLFFEGVRFPLSYSFFTDDLVNQIKERGVEHVVFVDFLSMYPRSSRENIRVNYLLQQLSLLYNDFSVEQSPYATLANDAQLLYRLKSDRDGRILNAFRQEAMVRLGLYQIMQGEFQDDQRETVDGISLQEMTRLLRKEVNTFSPQLIQDIEKVSCEKMKGEVGQLKRLHGKTKDYVNIQELDCSDLILFSKAITKIYKEYVDNSDLKKMWSAPGDVLDKLPGFEGEVNKPIVLSDGKPAQLLYLFSKECKNPSILTNVLRIVRASWYGALLNLVKGQTLGSTIPVKEIMFFTPAVWVKKAPDGKIAVIRRLFDKPEGKPAEEVLDTIDLWNIARDSSFEWGAFGGKQYLLNLQHAQTDYGLFGFSADLAARGSSPWPCFDDAVNYFLKQYKKKKSSEHVMFTTKLWDKVNNDRIWKEYDWKEAVEQACKNAQPKKNPKTGKDNPLSLLNQQSNSSAVEGSTANWGDYDGYDDGSEDAKAAIRLGKQEDVFPCSLVIRALATLEMIAKDVNASIVVRRGNKKDFVAALKLFEKIFLPTYFDTIFAQDLFHDYEAITPLVEIEGWD